MPDYGSKGATCGLELELDSALLADPDSLRRQIHDAYQVAALAVAEQLGAPDQGDAAEPPAIAAPAAPAPSAPPAPRTPAAPAPPARPARQPSRPARRQDGPPETANQLYRYAADRGALNLVFRYGKDQGFPRQIREWTEDMVVEFLDAHPDLLDAPVSNGRSH
jgi:hypothetical protein